ncbi:leucine-rich repeat protein [Artemisia annua]|uniref:Leucine-rich repeat protein n=1 Tax=Artemisia annua TaxID=35608 RepID=A0A2U1L1J7_ARTAN|nr:leucine-rich repeat protein [Artemisia annua]
MNPWLPNKQAIPFLVFTFLQIIAFSTVIHTKAVDDRVALLAIKSKINGDPQGVMSSWNDSVHFCQWEGIACGSRHQRVTNFNLSSRGISGSLSPSIGNLSFLKVILLQNNLLSGEIPPQVGRLIRLKELHLYNNSFQGKIPPSLANCSNLEALHMGSNNLVGKIPDEFGSLYMLKLLNFYKNKIEGGIPQFIGNLTFLRSLSFANCGLGGRIPDVFHQLSNLRRIALLGNNLVGTVPRSFYNLSSLELVYFDNNRLTGGLPINFGLRQPRLNVLSLSDNQFTGSLPPSLLNSQELLVLDVARNNFSGKLVITSHKICNLEIVSLNSNGFGSGEDDDELLKFVDALSICKSLGLLNLSYNRMRGFLPDSLGNLSASLYYLGLRSNVIQGSLPASIGNLISLMFLDVNSNLIEGPIPPSICSFNNLRYLDMSNNSFGGVIPQCFGKIMSSLEVIDLGNNFLGGTIPIVYKNCGRLEGLILNGNQLEGEVPSSLSKCQSLKVLDLGNNNLNGTFPIWSRDLPKLSVLVLRSNNFQGPIETSSTTQLPFSSLRVLDLSHNGFIGNLPEKYFESFNSMKNAPKKSSKPEYLTIRGMTYDVTIVNPSTPNDKVDGEEEDEESRFTWKVVMLGYGCGTFLGVVLGCLMLSTGRPKWFNANVDAIEHLLHTRRNKRRYRYIGK